MTLNQYSSSSRKNKPAIRTAIKQLNQFRLTFYLTFSSELPPL